MSKPINCWHCRNVIENEDDIFLGLVGNKNFKFHKGLKCYESYKNKKQDEVERKKISEGWTELDLYLRKEVFKHIPNRSLSRKEVRYLQDLRNGGLVRTNNKVSSGGYPYPIMLLTLKAKKVEIDKAFMTKTFENEEQRFRYVMAIMRNSINDVYYRYLQKERNNKLVEEQIKKVEPVVTPGREVSYVKKSEVNSKSSLFDDIW